MSILLAIVGVLLLLICLAGVALGIYMATDARTREPGVLFAFWWVSGSAGAAGIAMRDGVTFLVGALCFLVAGAAFLLFGGVQTAPNRRQDDGPRGPVPEGSEKTTKENRSSYRQRRAAS